MNEQIIKKRLQAIGNKMGITSQEEFNNKVIDVYKKNLKHLVAKKLPEGERQKVALNLTAINARKGFGGVEGTTNFTVLSQPKGGISRKDGIPWGKVLAEKEGELLSIFSKGEVAEVIQNFSPGEIYKANLKMRKRGGTYSCYISPETEVNFEKEDTLELDALKEKKEEVVERVRSLSIKEVFEMGNSNAYFSVKGIVQHVKYWEDSDSSSLAILDQDTILDEAFQVEHGMLTVSVKGRPSFGQGSEVVFVGTPYTPSGKKTRFQSSFSLPVLVTEYEEESEEEEEIPEEEVEEFSLDSL